MIKQVITTTQPSCIHSRVPLINTLHVVMFGCGDHIAGDHITGDHIAGDHIAGGHIAGD